MTPNVSKYLLLVALLCIPLMPAPAHAQPSTINIGAWNIQYLGSKECRAGKPAQDPEEIADFVIASGVDVLGLEEITDDDNGYSTFRNKTLTSAMTIIRQKTGNTWNYELFRKFQRGTGCKAKNVQLVGVAWNASKATKKGVIKIEMKPPSHMKSVWNRHPYAVKFSFGQNKTDVVVIVVHMKSNVPSSGGPDTALQRQWEAKLLVQRLAFVKAYFRDQDIIILGDTNVLGANESAVSNFVSAGFADLNSQDNPTTIRNEAFDRIFLMAGQPEFTNSRQEVFGPNYLNYDQDTFIKKLSDHYLVKTSIVVSADDDH